MTTFDWILIFGACAILISVIGLFVLGIIWSIKTSSRTSRLGTRSKPQGTNPIINTQQQEMNFPAQSITVSIPGERELGSEVDAKRIMSNFERSFFWTLNKAVQKDFYIFPQVPIRQLASQTQTRWLDRDLTWMLNKGIVDFLLVSPDTLEAAIAFEFDDPSHRQADARARDRRKEKLLEHVDIPLIRFRSGEKWDINDLRLQIQESAASNQRISFLTDSECRAFKLLREAKVDFYVFPKVPLDQIIQRKNLLSSELFKALKNDSVDFLLADPKYLGTLLVVSLKPLEYSDIGNLLNQAQIPWISFSGGVYPTPVELREKIHQALPKW